MESRDEFCYMRLKRGRSFLCTKSVVISLDAVAFTEDQRNLGHDRWGSLIYLYDEPSIICILRRDNTIDTKLGKAIVSSS